MAPVIASALRQAQAAQEKAPTPTPEPNSGLGLGGTPGNDESAPATNTTTILIIVIVICGSAIMSAALFYIFDRKKNTQFREACKRDPYLTRKEFARRRKLSALERLEEEELQRSIMIRKSLACRTPSRSNSRGSSDGESDLGEMQMQQHQRLPEPLYDPHHHDQALRSEWAPSEARRARSDSESSSSASLGRRYAEPHPGVEVEVPLPPPSRSPSPARTPLIRKPVPPPMPAIYVPAGESPRQLRTLSRGSDIPTHLQ